VDVHVILCVEPGTHCSPPIGEVIVIDGWIVYTHTCERIGFPPTHADGEDVVTVLVCVPDEEQALHEEYVKLVQVGAW